MMKKMWLLLIAGVICFKWSNAQVESDALRYSFLTPGGTARIQAVGGTGVSLGGDPSLMSLNPAAIGLFKTSDFSITPGVKVVSNTGNYLDRSASDNKTNLYIQQLALILATSSRHKNPDSKWKNVTVGFGLNRLANFNQNIYYRGNNSQSSYSDNYLIQLANGGYTNSDVDLNDIASNFPYGLSQAYLTGLIGPYVDNNGIFDGWGSLPGDMLNNGNALTQSNSISTKGGLNEFNLAVAGNYNDRLFIGIGLNVPSINYDKTGTIRETNNTDKNSFLNFYEVTDKVHTDGVGINGKLGVIYAVNTHFRIGAAFHSPTLFSMHDTYTTTMVTNTTDQGVFTSTTTDITDGYPGEYDYSLTTPWRAMGGISYVIGTNPEATHHGFISLDYEYVNYSAARFHFNGSNSTTEDKEYADALNESISQMYRGASNVRLGGEVKFNLFAVRAGIAYMGSPYSDDYTKMQEQLTDANINAAQMRYSLGLGYRNNGFYADLTYVYTKKGSRFHQPYLVDKNTANIPSPPPAVIEGNISNILLTIGFKL